MRLARDSRYAIEALLVLATLVAGRVRGRPRDRRGRGPAGRVPVEDLQQLAGDGVLVATRGRGYRLARPAEEIQMKQVIHVIEGGDADLGHLRLLARGVQHRGPVSATTSAGRS